ncbi:hypothetical protein PQR53_20000 [Paraburkholderia fungorum]|jgi:hypothetical protein|uniref:hypothetical protein n=1 Tax=Paraburkholderia fungorum TaxID=134537 RepID=UPI0038BAC1CF
MRLFEMGSGTAAGLKKASKNDPFDGAEFRCSAAKAFDYISFHDKAAAGRAGSSRPPASGTIARQPLEQAAIACVVPGSAQARRPPV